MAWLQAIGFFRQPRTHRTEFSRALEKFSEHLYGQILFRVLRLRYVDELNELKPLARHLENNVFRDLRKGNIQCLTAAISEEGLALSAGRAAVQPSNVSSPEIAKAFRSLGIDRVILDTQLEYGQIVETYLVLRHVQGQFSVSTPASSAYAGWNRRRIAAAMLGEHGYKKFCARVRFDPNDGTLEVLYDYCPLFFSRAVHRYANLFGRHRDHRDLFDLAPRAGALLMLLFLAPAALEAWSPLASVAATLVMGAGAAIALYAGIHAIGSIQYDREHYERLKEAAHDHVRRLSRFPECNPNPVLELNADGLPVYANPAARRLALLVAGGEDDLAVLLPKTQEVAASDTSVPSGQLLRTEHKVGDYTLNYVISPFLEDGSTIVSGSDVSHLKRLESELRHLNGNLEQLVAERTKEVVNTQEVTILALAGLAERRDPETGKHIERTRHFVRILALQLQEHPRFREVLDGNSIAMLFKSAPLHDIGKVGVPDHILLKPGRLTEDEFREIQRHPVYGGDALKIAEERLGYGSFLSLAKDIAYHHHERWDGRGYPFGLAGDAIPWAARLMAVADVYDALTSERPYKKAWSHAEAREEILRCRGTQFDPEVVGAFLTAESEFIRIANTFQEEMLAVSGCSTIETTFPEIKVADQEKQ